MPSTETEEKTVAPVLTEDEERLVNEIEEWLREENFSDYEQVKECFSRLKI